MSDKSEYRVIVAQNAPDLEKQMNKYGAQGDWYAQDFVYKEGIFIQILRRDIVEESPDEKTYTQRRYERLTGKGK
jgi:hypothetical protein